MKVKIAIEFEVEPVDDDDEMTEGVAKSAASVAAYDFLAFTESYGRTVGTEEVKVHVDGHGAFNVSIGEDHE